MAFTGIDLSSVRSTGIKDYTQREQEAYYRCARVVGVLEYDRTVWGLFNVNLRQLKQILIEVAPTSGFNINCKMISTD